MNTDRNSQVCMGQIPGIERPVSRLFFGTASPPVSSDEPAASELLDSIDSKVQMMRLEGN